VTQASQFKLTLIERHSKILKDLAATRSSKKDKKIEDDASKTASILMRRVQELATGLGVKSQDVLEVDYDEDYADDTIIDERDYDESCVIIDSEEEE
jgi:type IV pilus biogenesis protein CpaD/CtpE